MNTTKNAKPKFLFFQPYLKEVIWAGSHLQKEFSTNFKIGEAWLLSAIPGKESICLNSEYKNKTLLDIFSNYPFLFNVKKNTQYPNLTKIIDTDQPLSVQVHPDNEMAKKYNSFGKDECWYVLNNNDQKYILGTKITNLNELHKKILNNDFTNIFLEHTIKKDDFLYIPSGTIHAIPAQTTVFELQQSSDITFRIYDYDRIDNNGQKRPLHIQESIESIKLNNDHFILKQPLNKLVDNHFFHLVKLEHNNLNPQRYNFDNSFWLEITVVEGGGWIDGISIKKYDSFIMTTNNNSFDLSGKIKLLINQVKINQM